MKSAEDISTVINGSVNLKSILQQPPQTESRIINLNEKGSKMSFAEEMKGQDDSTDSENAKRDVETFDD